VWEIWPHLTAGASLHIADELTRRSPPALRDWLVAERITISFVPTVLAEQNTNYFQINFIRRPAEPGVTWHVQTSADLVTWSDIATYSSTNSVLTAQVSEVSRTGSPNETVTLRSTAALAGQTARFLRVNVTRP